MSIRFGNDTSQVMMVKDDSDNDSIKPFSLPYRFNIKGLDVGGEETIVEDIFSTDKLLFIAISFPSLGILVSDDSGQSYKVNLFRSNFFDEYYQNAENDDEKNDSDKSGEYVKSLDCHFAKDKNNSQQFAISIGPFLFTTEDSGETWDKNTVFPNLEKSHIRQIISTDDGQLFVFKKNMIAVSSDWGKSWDKHSMPGNFFNSLGYQFISAAYDENKKLLYISLDHITENTEETIEKTFNFIEKKVDFSSKSGIFYSENGGKSFISCNINGLYTLTSSDNDIYAVPLYNQEFYNWTFDDAFKNTLFYKSGSLNNGQQPARYFLEQLNDFSSKNLHLVQDESTVIKIVASDNYSFIEIKDTDSGFYNIAEDIQYNDYYYSSLFLEPVEYFSTGSNFMYDYQPSVLFSKWTGYRTHSPVLYTTTPTGIISFTPDKKMLMSMYEQMLNEKITDDSINPFLRKKDQTFFYNPSSDPTGGFPVKITLKQEADTEKWAPLIDENIVTTIDPAGQYRSKFFWYKNIDRKQKFELKLSFGDKDGVDLMAYPNKILYHKGLLFVQMNYFDIKKSYKNLFTIPIANIQTNENKGDVLE